MGWREQQSIDRRVGRADPEEYGIDPHDWGKVVKCCINTTGAHSSLDPVRDAGYELQVGLYISDNIFGMLMEICNFDDPGTLFAVSNSPE